MGWSALTFYQNVEIFSSFLNAFLRSLWHNLLSRDGLVLLTSQWEVKDNQYPRLHIFAYVSHVNVTTWYKLALYTVEFDPLAGHNGRTRERKSIWIAYVCFVQCTYLTWKFLHSCYKRACEVVSPSYGVTVVNIHGYAPCGRSGFAGWRHTDCGAYLRGRGERLKDRRDKIIRK